MGVVKKIALVACAAARLGQAAALQPVQTMARIAPRYSRHTEVDTLLSVRNYRELDARGNVGL